MTTAFELFDPLCGIINVALLWWALARINRLEKAAGK